MAPSSRPGPLPGRPGPDILLRDPRWRRQVRDLERRVGRACALPGSDDGRTGPAAVVLSSDREVRRLNHRHRGRDKPTNVLTFEPCGAGDGGEMVLAWGVVRREALAAGRPVWRHLAHLLVHGALHLRGHDHHHPGDARRMEMAEARLLHRLRVPNPWKPT